jgi:hypothetical protein
MPFPTKLLLALLTLSAALVLTPAAASNSCTVNGQTINVQKQSPTTGRVIATPKIYVTIWATQGNPTSANFGLFNQVTSNWLSIGNSPVFYSRLSEYGIATGTLSLEPSGFPIVAPVLTIPNSTIGGSDVESLLYQQLFINGALPSPDDNTLYVVLLDQSVNLLTSPSNAVGYHQHFVASLPGPAGTIIRKNVFYGIAKFPTSTQAPQSLSMSQVISHEISEALVDPDGSGYLDPSLGANNDEIGDICYGFNGPAIPGAGVVNGTILQAGTFLLGGYVQPIWSQAACRCVETRNVRSFDFDGNWKADISVVRPMDLQVSNDPTWFALNTWLFQLPYGSPGDVPIPADYDGDGVVDLAVLHPADFTFWIRASSTGQQLPSVQWGESGDIPAPADYDGDGTADIAIYRPASKAFWARSVKGAPLVTNLPIQSSFANLVPVPADYDGIGKAEPAVYDPLNAIFLWLTSSSGVPFGSAQSFFQFPPTFRPPQSGTIPVPGDYDGDRKADFVVFSQSDGNWWFVFSSHLGQVLVRNYGVAGDVPAPADYDGDGIVDLGIFRPHDPNLGGQQSWWVLPTLAPPINELQWGLSTDMPLPRSY